MNRINLDFETRSSADIRNVGAYRYAEDASTEILIVAVSHNGGAILTWDARHPVKGNPALDLLRTAITGGYEIHAFNSQFEYAILKYVATRQWGFPAPDVNRMRCTAAVCRAAGLPPSLARAAEFLKLSIQKDKMGGPLIGKFSIPQKDGVFRGFHDTTDTYTVGGEKHTDATAFQKFVDYCVRDVETEMLVAKTMEPFALTGRQLDSFLLDARMNDRGVPVDVPALLAANKLVNEYRILLTVEFKTITGLAPTQNAKCLKWLQERGYKGVKLNKESRVLYGKSDSMTPEAKRALRLMAELSYAAVKKIPSMLQCVMSDGRIRGSFMWCGAQKTGRWSCKTPQWQNMKKPEKDLRDDIEAAYQDVRSGVPLSYIEGVYGNPYKVLACLARYFVRFDDLNILDADFASVEAKILPQLIGCQRILDTFGTDGDLYSNTARDVGAMFGETLTRDHGKTLVLATQFGGGKNAVFTATGKTWSMDKCAKVVSLIREKNPEFPEAWRTFADAFAAALDNPGQWQEAGKYVAYGYTKKAPFPRMAVRLPSGRKIILPYPAKDPITMVRVDNEDGTLNRWERTFGHLTEAQIRKDFQFGDAFINPGVRYGSHFHTWELSFYGHTKGVNYGRVKTYGGDLLQSATQATGVDLLVEGVLQTETIGHAPFFVVHDQCLAPEHGSADEFTSLLCTVPDWFKGFPLDAQTETVRSYCKS
jgi:DNA polymerase